MSLPRMSLHIGDYLKDTAHLSAPQHGAYMLLIMHYWSNGGLPDDDKQLAAIARMALREWHKARPVIEPLFKGDGPWRHKRIDAEHTRAVDKYEQKVAAGKESARKRKASQFGEPTDVGTDVAETLQQPITNNPIKKEEKRADARGDRECESLVGSPLKSNSEYAFEGEVIKLKHKHFDQWKRAYSALDLLAELTARDVWLLRQPAKDRENWFISTSKYLANRNQEARAKSSPQKIHWPSGIEGVV